MFARGGLAAARGGLARLKDGKGDLKDFRGGLEEDKGLRGGADFGRGRSGGWSNRRTFIRKL